MEGIILTLMVVILFGVIIGGFLYCSLCVVIVKQGTRKVVERFGCYRKTLSEGFHVIFKPFDKIAPVPWDVLSISERDELNNRLVDEYENDENYQELENAKQSLLKIVRNDINNIIASQASNSNVKPFDIDNYILETSGMSLRDIALKLCQGKYQDANRNFDIYVKRQFGLSKCPETTILKINRAIKLANLDFNKSLDATNTAVNQVSIYIKELILNNLKEKNSELFGNTNEQEPKVFTKDPEALEKVIYAIEVAENKENEIKNQYAKMGITPSNDLILAIKKQQHLNQIKKTYPRHQDKNFKGSKHKFPLNTNTILDYVDLRERYIDSETASENNTHPYKDQAVITKDNATVKVNTIIFFMITDVFQYYYGAKEPEKAIALLTISTLRNLIANLTLEETLCSRTIINKELRETLDEATNAWGIKVNRVEIKEIILDPELAKAMNDVTISEREKRAIMLRAEGKAYETEITRGAEAEGFKKIQNVGISDELLKIRSYEALETLGQGSANKIFVPTDLSGFLTGAHVFADALNDKKPVEKETKEEKQNNKDGE